MPKQSIGQHSVESLRAIRDRLLAVAGELDRVADAMQRQKLEQLAVLYHNEMRRALDSLPKFANSAKEGYQRWEEERGSLGVEVTGKQAPNTGQASTTRILAPTTRKRSRATDR